ncbi:MULTISPECIES: flagellar motor switch protein FliG [Anaerotruncus]|uniref:Flagellar motor switch protein FliG n=1 Tax=Anaerotruncus colihominis TaxID=169435 RepID=A0A845RCM9_9FIRM|nr:MULTISPECIES: flagellar motor switch protein FliG [Anaerotruncus]MCI8492907.1 flagellar motor switch protein FliG [Anaerotruncus sp.]MCR2024315.1 flagellar motor switch protein FliG [Anaerotruncus colihominis]NBI77453.1 flagellar motor switch protein FliG [Anaerotruncus colihominis]NDO39138.1 flagellar motor switch protein FliG [Anaerotruncus colihominis]
MATKSKLTALQRAAVIIISLGAQRASDIYKFLKEEEVEQLSLEIAKMERLSEEEMQETIEDFYGLCVTQKVINEGGTIYARDVLEKAFGADQAASFMARISKSLKTQAFEFIRKADYKSLQMVLQSEHPQTIALVLSYARSEQASMIIAELPKQLQINVIKRIADLGGVMPGMIAIVEKTLQNRFASIVSTDQMEVGGVTYIADIMNHVDRSTEKYVFDELSENDPELAEEIRKLMFVFEDIANLDSMAVQRFIREVDTKDLAIALKASNEEVKEVILHNMSSRMRETIETDIQYLHNIRMRDVEEAQQKIVGVIRQLEESGEIVIARGKDDEIIA